MKNFSIIIVLCAFLTLLGASHFSYASVKLGVVDMQKAIQATNMGKTAKTNLEKEFNKKKGELEKEEKAILKLKEEFEKQSLVWNDQTRNKKQGELQQRAQAFQEKMANAQMDIQKKEQELTQPIVDKLKQTIEEVAKAKKMTTVLEKSSNVILYWQADDEITDEVIKKFNEKNKG
jgi:outer membrane protein